MYNRQNLTNNTQKKALFPLRIAVCFLVLFFSQNTFSQTKKQKDLEAKRTQLQKEIKKVNSLLFSTKKEGKTLLNQVGDLNQKIRVRTKLISTIKQESGILNKRINSNKNKINSLNKELKLLKEDYAEMIYKSYKSKSMQSRMLFVLSSENFHQAYKRMQYMDQYTDFRKKQGEGIAVKTKEIEKINDTLKVQKIQKENLLTEHKEEQSIIELEKKEQQRLFAKVKSKEKKYSAQIKKKQKEERKIDQQIEKIIRDAIAASKKKNKGSSSSGFSLTPEAKILAAKFAQNKGKLPWPVLNALVVRNFGQVPHQTIPSLKIQSNGIHIATDKGANAKAVFEGNVLEIQISSNGLKTVYIQHGNYISLYSNLESINVQKGDPIILKQNLGKIFTDKLNGKTILIFQIWKDTRKENPKSWLLRL